ncbi:MAG: T9SS type A sorting domain-containing protein [Candidatus Eisenbacteria bacterium]|nr:T9SS type A sorting domain-containing protein [Candidatus Eisenbacteria bacterium]
MRNPRKTALYIVIILLAIFLRPTPVFPSTVDPYNRIAIHTPDEILNGMTASEDGVLYLTRNLRKWELITDVMDARIPNKGDGAFHTMNVSRVVDALRKIRFPLEGVSVDIFILPYPRAETQGSSATGNAIFLSPGVREYSQETIEYVASHEMGHIVQRQYMPETRKDLWAQYKALRQISDESEYNENSAHDNRPREVFAEDFRMLFSDATSEGELALNGSVPPPEDVAGLKSFFLSLVSNNDEQLSLKLSPNPVKDGTTFTFETKSSRDVSVRIFDVSGRLVKTLVENQRANRQMRVFWDGNDSNGRALPAGIYFARLSTPQSYKVERVLLVR